MVAVVVVTVIVRFVEGRHRNRRRRSVVVGWCRVVSCRAVFLCRRRQEISESVRGTRDQSEKLRVERGVDA